MFSRSGSTCVEESCERVEAIVIHFNAVNVVGEGKSKSLEV